jgi:hypothetical protein
MQVEIVLEVKGVELENEVGLPIYSDVVQMEDCRPRGVETVGRIRL